ncbi:MAG: hypothetical protein CMJ49_05690 [Planctomycetaceae bacterium]|nr:hypothetical protein [Planctomycetaceae bacterium]
MVVTLVMTVGIVAGNGPANPGLGAMGEGSGWRPESGMSHSHRMRLSLMQEAGILMGCRSVVKRRKMRIFQ